MSLLKRLGLVGLVTWLGAFPAALIASNVRSGSTLYDVASLAASALGMAVAGFVLPLIILVAGRDRRGGALTPALIASFLMNAWMTYIAWAYLRPGFS